MTRIITWNVNGIRSIAKKDFFNDLKVLAPDVLCLQETKASADEVDQTLEHANGFHVYSNSSKARKGYSGTAVVCKEKPVDVLMDIGMAEHDREGRVVTAEFNGCFVVSVYVPNSGEGLARLDYRIGWDAHFRQFIQWLDRRKPVIICRDFNVAREPIDIARPKENYNKSAGYTQREIDSFDKLLSAGFTDVWRTMHPEEVKYSYWNYWMNAREKNVGWRIDYILVSNRIASRVKASEIHNECFGSDHCPVSIEVD